MGTANVARDLDLLRAAVGDEQLNYLGFSYGTVIGATYATLFPGRTRAMVLDSPVDVAGVVRRARRELAGAGLRIRERARPLLHRTAPRPGRTAGSAAPIPRRPSTPCSARLDREPLPSPDPALRPLNGDLVLVGAASTLYGTVF